MKPIPNTEAFINELNEIYTLFSPAFAFNLYGKEVYLSKINQIHNSIEKITTLLSEVKNEFWMNLEIDSFDFMIEFSRIKFKGTLERYNSIISEFDTHISNSLDLLVIKTQITNEDKTIIFNILAGKTWNIYFIIEDLTLFFNELKASKYPVHTNHNTELPPIKNEKQIINIDQTKVETTNKTVDPNLTLRSIIYDNYYSDAKDYYTNKLNKVKKINQGQYGQLINEFIKKNWVKPEFKNITNRQQSIIVFNEFNIRIKPDTLSSYPTYNIFEDLKFQKPTTLIF